MSVNEQKMVSAVEELMDGIEETLTDDVMIPLLVTLQRLTPVVTGEARAGWSVYRRARTGFRPPENGGIPESPGRALSKLEGFKIGERIGIENNVPHIENFGRQKNGGFVIVGKAVPPAAQRIR